MTDQKTANASSTRRRRQLLGVVVVFVLVLVGGGPVGLAWFVEYGTARAHTTSPLHEDKRLDHVIPSLFWVGMTRDEFNRSPDFLAMRTGERSSTLNRVVGVYSDTRRRFRPNPSPALRIEIEFENDKVIAARWLRFEEKW